MSIATELTRLDGNATSLATAKTAIASAITAKGGTVASGDGFADFATDIESIPSGGETFYGVRLIPPWSGRNTPIIADLTNFPTMSGTDGKYEYMFYNSSTNGNAGRFNQLEEIYLGDTNYGTCEFYNCNHLKYLHYNVEKLDGIGESVFFNCALLKAIVSRQSTYRFGGSFASGASALETILLIGTEVNTIRTSNALNGTKIANGQGYIYVADSLVDGFKTESNWSQYASQIKGHSNVPSYNASSPYIWDDFVQYQGSIYRCISKTSISGNSPSGTTSDNMNWQYICEVMN